MDENLKAALEVGETLLWHGRPEKFEVMDKTHKKAYTTKTVVSVIVSLLLIVGYILLCGNTGSEVKWVLVAIILVAGLYMAFDNNFTCNKLAKKVSYAVTDKRLLSIGGFGVNGIEYATVKEAKLITDEDGHCTLLCGKYAVKEKAHKHRQTATLGGRLDSETGECDSLVFYAIPEADKFTEIIKKYLPL